MGINEFKQKLFQKAEEIGFTNYELSYSNSESFKAEIYEGAVSKYSNSTTASVSFRGLYNGKMGYCSGDRVDEIGIDFLILEALKNAEVKEDEDEYLYEGDSSYPEIPKISKALLEISAKEKIDFGKSLEREAKALDKRIQAIDYCVVQNSISKHTLANSYGLDLSYESGSALAYVGARAVEEDKVALGLELFSGRDFEKLNTKEIAKKAVDNAIAELGSTSVESGEYKIIIENTTAGSLISTFVSNFFAETAQKGLSMLNGKLNEKIASDKITIRDDYMHEKSTYARSFDSEGVSCKNKVVVENGVLKTFLHNLKSSKKDGVAPTGNGIGSSTSYINFYVEPSGEDLDSLLAKMDNGILITSLSGLHSGANPISGDFSLQSKGFLIENGKKAAPIKNFVLSGNFYKMLKDVEQVASDLDFEYGSIGSPSLWVKGLVVAGE